MFAGGAHDEGPDGPLRVPSNGGRSGEGKGRGVGGWVGGVEGLEGHPGEEVRPEEEAPRRGRGADGGTKKSAQGQGGWNLPVQEAASSS